MKTREFIALQEETFTPANHVDLSFTWIDDQRVVVSRSPEKEWENDPAKRILPSLYGINLVNHKQQQQSSPPSEYGDFNPIFLPRVGKLAWTHSNWEKHDVWIANTDGSSPEIWIENVDHIETVSWYK